LLEGRGIPYRYREYRKEPLSAVEISGVLELLDVGVRDVLRRNDKAYRELGLSGDEDEQTLIELMTEHPTLLQRPIALLDGRAALGRPVENLLALLGD